MLAPDVLGSDPRAAARAFDLRDLPPGYYESPAPWFALLRSHDPVHRNADGSVLLTRHADVRHVWRDPTGLVDKRDEFTARFGEGPLLEHHTTGMLFRDPPDHDRLRALVRSFFSQRSVTALTDDVQRLVDELLDEAQERGEVDFVSDVALRLPIAVICRILGLPRADGDRVHELGARILFPLNPAVEREAIAAGHQAAAELLAYLREHLERARAVAGRREPTDLIAGLAAAERAGAEVSEAELLHMCILMLNGGHETTTNLLAVSLHSLLDAPDQLADLRAGGPEIVRTAVEECIRFVTPLQLQGRRTTQAVELPSGGRLDPGTEVILCQASANRDERVFAEPDRLDLRRRPNGHVAFGAGIHVCIGRTLARLETSIALPAIVRRFSRIERTGRARFNRNARFRGLAELPLSLKA